MSLLDFIGGSVPRSTPQLERDIEDAMEDANARWGVEHEADGRHKALAALTVDGDASVGGTLATSGARTLDGRAERTLTATVHNAAAPDGLPYDVEILRLDADADRSLTGIVPAYPNTSQKLLVVNRSGYTITLVHNSSSSSAANRFACPGEADVAIVTGGRAELLYDPASDIWRVFGMSTVIKSIQRGTIDFTGGGTNTPTATITAVNTAKAVLTLLGFTTDTGGAEVRVALTDSTTVTATRNVAVQGAAITAGFQVVEYY